jgi:hypothetical protein
MSLNNNLVLILKKMLLSDPRRFDFPLTLSLRVFLEQCDFNVNTWKEQNKNEIS